MEQQSHQACLAARPLAVRGRRARRPRAELLARAARLSLSLGVALVLVATMWFFAANWQGLSRFAKLGLLGVGLMTSYAVGASLAYRSERYRFEGLLLMHASP